MLPTRQQMFTTSFRKEKDDEHGFWHLAKLPLAWEAGVTQLDHFLSRH